MICPKCKRKLLQISGRWTPHTPNRTYRKYICDNCRIGYTEIVDTDSHKVGEVDETVLVGNEKQTSLMEWI